MTTKRDLIDVWKKRWTPLFYLGGSFKEAVQKQRMNRPRGAYLTERHGKIRKERKV